jgi:predicted DNA-binding transcriptional regulator AlpA
MADQAQRSHLTVADLCSELGIARSTFYDWRSARKAPCCIKLPNGAIRIRRVDLERWLQSHEDVGDERRPTTHL